MLSATLTSGRLLHGINSHVCANTLTYVTTVNTDVSRNQTFPVKSSLLHSASSSGEFEEVIKTSTFQLSSAECG